MRSFINKNPHSSELNFFGDKEGHSFASLEGPTTIYQPNFELTKNKKNFKVLKQGADTLFDYHHEPPKLDVLTSTAPHQVPGVVAAANIHSRDRWGQDLVPSDNLSEHSMSVVQGFADMGAIPQSSVAPTVRNNLSHTYAKTMEEGARIDLADHDTDGYSYLGEEDHGNALYNAGREQVRGMIRNRRNEKKAKNGQAQQFTQDSLPGIDWSQH